MQFDLFATPRLRAHWVLLALLGPLAHGAHANTGTDNFSNLSLDKLGNPLKLCFQRRLPAKHCGSAGNRSEWIAQFISEPGQKEVLALGAFQRFAGPALADDRLFCRGREAGLVYAGGQAVAPRG